jgi:hypothetical protein
LKKAALTSWADEQRVVGIVDTIGKLVVSKSSRSDEASSLILLFLFVVGKIFVGKIFVGKIILVPVIVLCSVVVVVPKAARG